MISKLELENFTVFKEKQTLKLSKGINIIIGENGTGKSHLLKLLYSISNAIPTGKGSIEQDITNSIVKNFMPIEDKIFKLRSIGADEPCSVRINFDNDTEYEFSFNLNSKQIKMEFGNGELQHYKEPVFLPTKEVLSIMEGFVSLYTKYELSFDKTYFDLCYKLDLPKMREENLEEKSKWAIKEIESIIGGNFIFHGGGRVTFKTKNDEFSVNVMAEGFRKAGILSRLLETGIINPGTSGTLFWDEPESNINPQLMKQLVGILLELARNGQQIVLATHDYVLLKWFELLSDEKKGDHINYISLGHLDSGVEINNTEEFLSIKHDSIGKTFLELYDADIDRAME